MKPMPSPRGTNFAGRYLPDSFFERPRMAQDAMPRAAIGRGARDDDPDNGSSTVIASSPADAVFRKLFQFLSDRLSPEDVQEAAEMVRQLFSDTAPSNNGNGMAGDSSRRLSYLERFPNANRLYRKQF